MPTELQSRSNLECRFYTDAIQAVEKIQIQNMLLMMNGSTVHQMTADCDSG